MPSLVLHEALKPAVNIRSSMEASLTVAGMNNKKADIVDIRPPTTKYWKNQSIRRHSLRFCENGSYRTTKYFILIEGIYIFRTHGGDACIESREVEHALTGRRPLSASMRLSTVYQG